MTLILNPFQAAWLASASSKQLVSESSLQLNLTESFFVLFCFLFVCLFVFSFIAYSGRDRPRESDQFQELPETILSCFPSYQRNFPCSRGCFSLGGNC
jgi:preprotein translocase subunit SecG